KLINGDQIRDSQLHHSIRLPNLFNSNITIQMSMLLAKEKLSMEFTSFGRV
ncbi:hypothetical protein MKX01_020072, partial [Papaver californicum]